MTRTPTPHRNSRCRRSSRQGSSSPGCSPLGLSPASASAQERYPDRGYRHHWSGGYYRAPPVVYGSPYRGRYYGEPTIIPPPVVYGPGIGIDLGGVGIRIR